jgi:hypothetical protein
MLFHAGLNAWPEMFAPAFSGPDLERLLSLYGIVSIAAGAAAAFLFWPRLAQRPALQEPLVVPTPVTA